MSRFSKILVAVLVLAVGSVSSYAGAGDEAASCTVSDPNCGCGCGCGVEPAPTCTLGEDYCPTPDWQFLPPSVVGSSDPDAEIEPPYVFVDPANPADPLAVCDYVAVPVFTGWFDGMLIGPDCTLDLRIPGDACQCFGFVLY